MLFPLVFSLIGLLLFILIGYNIVQQYKQKVEAEKRLSIAKQRAVIVEVDELLLNATRIPFSRSLLLILQNRIRNALKIMVSIAPTTPAIKEHLSNTEAQIQQIKNHYTPPDDSVFRTPDSDKEALMLLQVTKKIRAVLRSEHAKGKINTAIFVEEDHRLEIMQLKINLENSIKRVLEARENKQFGTANQMINKLLKVLSTITDKDSYLARKQQELLEYKNEIKSHLMKNNDQELKAMRKKEEEKKHDLDELFADKKKW